MLVYAKLISKDPEHNKETHTTVVSVIFGPESDNPGGTVVYYLMFETVSPLSVIY